MEQRISLVTLGVRDLATCAAFYRTLGWRSRDDPDAESGALDTESLLSQALGARLIEEIKND